MTHPHKHPYHMACCIRRGTAEVLCIEVFKVRLSNSDRNSDSQTRIVDERHYRIITLAADNVLVSTFVHSGHIPIAILRELFDGMVGDTIRPWRFVELIQRFFLTLPFLPTLQTGTAAATSNKGPDKGNAVVNPSNGNLQIVCFFLICPFVKFVGAEWTQQQGQEQVQHLSDNNMTSCKILF